MDLLITGEGYNFKDVLVLDDVAKAKLKNLKAQYAQANRDDLVIKIEEALGTPKSIKYVPSTTMITKFDKYEVIGYSQRVNEIEVPFELDQIIKFTFEELDGKVEGYTPFLSLPLHLELLWLMWQNQWYLQAKGNHPDLIVSVEGVDINNPSYLKLQLC
jgi:hypothetical protein